ncbi:ribulose-phosphate 3-epimerase [Candidatus Aerophobetes bacterium]|uniref:Ribulose-phosphate 3-epimerase n=1 Tax=Aerophobetes bacterium TaxID=2030807 RepID=A0A523S2D9_UNCAE|nr:MAG: ribulose-phosphate 3-epimerase [Candidatus Aerophobetes bacterium]
MKIKLSASIMCANFSHLERDIRILEEEGVDYLHFDIMDGHFVPNFTMGPDILASLRKITDLPFDTHLMIEDPHKYISTFVEAGSTFISIHVETCPHLDKTIQLIKKKGAKVRVALNPATPLCRLEYILEEISSVLVMTVNPGFASQKLVPSTISKIEKLKEIIEKRALEVDIAVDGNVSFTHAPSMVKAGANVLVCGTSSIFHPEFGIKEGIAKLRKTLEFSLSHHC